MFDSVSKSERSLLSKNQKFSLPNLQEEAEMLEWAGVSFGEEFTYKLGKSMKVSIIINSNNVSAATSNHEWSARPQIYG